VEFCNDICQSCGHTRNLLELALGYELTERHGSKAKVVGRAAISSRPVGIAPCSIIQSPISRSN